MKKLIMFAVAAMLAFNVSADDKKPAKKGRGGGAQTYQGLVGAMGPESTSGTLDGVTDGGACEHFRSFAHPWCAQGLVAFDSCHFQHVRDLLPGYCTVS